MGPSPTSTPEQASVGPRLAPAARRQHLLGVARSLVEERGVAALSMENVAAEAGVSRALLYTYFDNRLGLVQALWDEVAALWDVEPMPPYEELLGTSSLRELFDRRLEENTRWYLDQIEESGRLFHRLLSEPSLEAAVEQTRKLIETNNIDWWARLVEAMGLDADRAKVFSSLINWSSQALWGLFARDDAPREVIEDLFFVSCRTTLDALLAETERAS